MLRRRSRLARRPAAIPALAILLALTACGPFRHRSARDEAGAFVTFVNESLMQVDLFAVTASGRYRLATVPAGQTQAIAVPRHVVAASAGGLSFVARLFPRRNVLRSERLSVMPGDRLTLRLPSTANLLAITPG